MSGLAARFLTARPRDGGEVEHDVQRVIQAQTGGKDATRFTVKAGEDSGALVFAQARARNGHSGVCQR